VLVCWFDKERIDDYLRLAASVRAAGLGCELFLEPKKLGQQLQYADKRGFRLALIAGERELSTGVVQIKDLQSGQSHETPLASVPQTLRGLLD
jgi:histidyl-tRNA synthetase